MQSEKSLARRRYWFFAGSPLYSALSRGLHTPVRLKSSSSLSQMSAGEQSAVDQHGSE
jgi:hypothetical protein